MRSIRSSSREPRIGWVSFPLYSNLNDVSQAPGYVDILSVYPLIIHRDMKGERESHLRSRSKSTSEFGEMD